MATGATYLVYIYLDEKSDRLVASSRLDRFLDNKELTVKEGDEAEVIIWEHTELGVKVVVNQRHQGLIYHDQLFKQVQEGETHTGYIHKIREDNKIDVSLQPVGFQKIEPNAAKILDKLRSAGGFLPYHDKSNPKDIQREFEMSKKTFKKAIGNLYRKRIISLDHRGIRMKNKG
jgi:predicted RNA-binding protein (virulence factor B family)